MKETLYCRMLRYALYAVFVIGVFGTVSLPFMLDTYARVVHGLGAVPDEYRTFILPFLIMVALPCLWIVLEMIRMLHSIPKGPFVMRNVHALYRTGILFLALSVAFIVKCFVFFTFLTLFCAFLFTGAGLFSFTLAALIKQAAVFREENELTI